MGRLLCQELAREGYSVTAFDLTFPDTEDEASGVTTVQVGLRVVDNMQTVAV